MDEVTTTREDEMIRLLMERQNGTNGAVRRIEELVRGNRTVIGFDNLWAISEVLTNHL